MRTPCSIKYLLAVVMASVTLLQTASATVYLWSADPPSTLSLWGTDTNWSPVGIPGAADTAVFGSTGTVADALTVNNVVSNDTTVAVLNYTNITSGTWHVTRIPPGLTLTVGSLNVGYSAAIGGGNAPASSVTSTAFRGNGTLVVTNSLNANNGEAATPIGVVNLDQSAIANFVFSNVSGTVSIGSLNRCAVNWSLASTNSTITAATLNLNTGSQNNGATGSLLLGTGSNIFHVSTINIAAGRETSPVSFAGSTGSLRIRGAAGTDDSLCNMTLGNRNTGGSGSPADATLSLNGHAVDMRLGTLRLGLNSGTPTAIVPGIGTISYDTGTIFANSIAMAVTTGNANGSANGTINVGASATLTVGSGGISLANQGASSGPAAGVLNITGGAVICSNSITKASTLGTGSMTNTGGSITMVSGVIGTPDVPINVISLSDATLTLDAGTGATNIVVNSLVTGSTANNTINITALPIITGYPTQIPLISYGSMNSYDFVRGSLPGTYTGYLSNNVALLRIDLVITGGPAVVRALTWKGNVNGDWDTSTANWLFGAISTTYVSGDLVTFNDTASGATTVNLTTSLTPNELTVNNNAKTYTFSGSGSIDGTVGLTKNGPGQLTIANSGVNTFSGGVNILGGTVRISGSDDRLPTNGVVTLADASGAALDLNNLNQTLGSLSGGGVAGGNVSLGSGTLTFAGDGGNHAGAISGSGKVVKVGSGTQVLSGANAYGGGTLVSEGTLAVANASGSGTGSGYVLVVSNATFSIGNGGTGGAIATATITNHGTVVLDRSDDFTLPQLITGEGVLIKDNTNNTATIATANSYTNETVIDGGALRISHANALGTLDGQTFIDNTASSRLELAGGITVLEQLEVSQKQGAAGNVPCVVNVSGNNTLAGPILAGEGGSYWRFRVDADKLTVSGSFTNITGSSPAAGRRLVLQGVGEGDWQSSIGNRSTPVSVTALIKEGTGTWTLSGTNTYTGATTIQEGALIVNGSLGNTAVDIGPFGTLGGTGVISGPVNAAGGILAPGASIGTLTISNNLTLSAMTVMEVSHAACDKIKGVNQLALGGTLQVVVQGDLQGAEIFKLFSAATITGDFAYDLPTLPGGLGWDTSTVATDGTLRVTGGTLTSPTLGVAQSGSDLVFSWNDVSFKLQAQTNSAGISNNWYDYPNGDTSPVLVPINPANPSVFFRLINQ